MIKTLKWQPKQKWHHIDHDGMNRIAVWQSSEFLVQVSDAGGGILWLAICRVQAEGNPLRERGYDWKAEISWDELQEIKRGCGYGCKFAVEVYPEDCNLVNVANMRHLWILPERLAFAWTRNADAI